MQITRPVISPQLQSTPAAIAYAPARKDWTQSARRAVRWLFDIDDGGGAITCFLCVIAVFGMLVVRLVELDHNLDAQSLKCTAIDQHTLQMRCEFE
jgi:hypothetical protein